MPRDRASPVDLSEVVRLAPQTPQFDELADWIDSAHPGPISVLDVGGGGSFYDFPAALRPRARRMVGVDPDAGVTGRPWLDEGHQLLVEEFAPTTAERFDVALCMYVIEHVEAPGAFLEAIRSLLAPGGSCFGVTPNLWHYFGLASAGAARARHPGVAAPAAAATRVDRGLSLARALPLQHHRPAASHCPRRRLPGRRVPGPRTGRGMFETYFPPWFRWAPRAYSRGINDWARPALFGTLLFRLVT